MRRFVPLAVLLAGVAVLAAGCGGGKTVAPVAETVVGRLQGPPPGNAAQGKGLFAQNCGGCHTFRAAGTNGKVGPNIAQVPEHAKAAGQGSVADYIRESMLAPNAYVVPGYPKPSPMPSYSGTFSAQQIADVVAFITSNLGGGGGNAGGGAATTTSGEGGGATTTSGSGAGETTATTSAAEKRPPADTTSTNEVAAADPQAGKRVFTSAGCSGCHTLKDANATGNVGPNLDQAKPDRALIVDRVTNGKDGMPSFKGQLSDNQIADVAAYVYRATHPG